jgi:thiamine transport system ATP-binding protein
MTLVVSDVCVTFEPSAAPVLDHVSLRIDTGEVVALLGPSGAGKSTLLRAIAGLVVPHRGTITVDERDVTHVPVHRRGIGLVFQDNQLFPHRDVAGNIEFGLRMHGEQADARGGRVEELLALVGLVGLGNRSVGSLSGGEAKRVALARSLAPRPPILLLDEPLTGLDDALHHRLTGDLRVILRATTTTVLLVTHDADEAAAIADRVVTLASLTASES